MWTNTLENCILKLKGKRRDFDWREPHNVPIMVKWRFFSMGLLILTLFSFFICPVEQTGVGTSFEQRDSIILHEEDKNMGKRASSVGLVQKRKIDATANHVETWVHKIEQAPHNIYLLISFVMFTFFLSSSSILYSLFLFLVTVCVFCRRVKPRRGACRADQSGPPIFLCCQQQSDHLYKPELGYTQHCTVVQLQKIA